MRRIIATLAAAGLLVVVGLVAAPAPRAEALPRPARVAVCYSLFNPWMFYVAGASAAGLRACLAGYGR